MHCVSVQSQRRKVSQKASRRKDRLIVVEILAQAQIDFEDNEC